MSKTYPAGVFVIDGNLLRTDRGSVMIGNASWPAIERAVLAKRDDELGRWRSKEHPEYVVYPKEDYVWVVNEVEPGMVSYPVRPGDTNESPYAEVAREYFDSTKPWLAAKPGEVWELTYGGAATAHVVTGGWNGPKEWRFIADRAVVGFDDPDITAGRRIYPEADNV